MEELIKILIEDGVIQTGDDRWEVRTDRLAQVRVPGTLTGLLQARLDSLSPDERTILQRAAVVGRIFWDSAVRTLEAADSVPIDAGRALAVLAKRELIYLREETAFAGSREYVFKSTMLRDVAYESLFKRQQRVYHAEVARWLIEIGERATEYTAQIAEHSERAGEYLQAADYLHRAGTQAREIGAYTEALSFLERGLTALKNQDDPAAKAWRATLLSQLGSICEAQGAYAEAESHLKSSLALGRELNDSKRIVEALTTLGIVVHRRGNPHEAAVHLEEGLALARQDGDDQGSLGRALMWLGASASTNQQHDKALAYLTEALPVIRAVGDRALEARALNVLGENARYQKQYDEADRVLSAGARHLRGHAKPVRNRSRHAQPGACGCGFRKWDGRSERLPGRPADGDGHAPGLARDRGARGRRRARNRSRPA